MPGDFRRLPVPEGLAGMRVDAALAKLFGISRSVAVEMIAAEQVLIDATLPQKSDRVTPGVIIEATLPEPKRAPEPVAEMVEGMHVLYHDADVIAVDKPVGVAAHPTLGWEGPTVLGGLQAMGFTLPDAGPPERKGIVQRLDVGTSGVMVVAASMQGYSVLKRAFKERTVDKTYHAVVQGLPDPIVGTIDAPIGRHPSAGWKFAVTDDGRASVTHYKVLEAFRQASLLEVHLETGRTHQIRVHMAATGHPCVGDPMYGSDPNLAKRLGLIRQWLHAKALGFCHPRTGEYMVVESGYPEDLQHALDMLRAP
ncbi:RluA family pseudouridine synthase [Corynebacterium imitans]|uniref:RluA family pseudouridine synthase n=1 Tax=Corynebacterium imitans TaxID=156978 RepID=UPI001EF1B131|nr:RluA family pseudouridine synthase [Corynebacterium imitans]MCG7277755.1 RluA family pseudouridine synthase [Corynebacterium imitans]MDK8305732.1 RluA family pseudouridine synthase [Corynebacterium imitans]MDK8636802.1 RluA family pseudouridine synthase [Corynebacterium imitans]MDK8772417.1 RluA family pseudouridine synthase [Corynebacterium imitans]